MVISLSLSLPLSLSLSLSPFFSHLQRTSRVEPDGTSHQHQEKGKEGGGVWEEEEGGIKSNMDPRYTGKSIAEANKMIQIMS